MERNNKSRSSGQTIAWWLFAFLWFLAWQFCFSWNAWSDPVRRVPGPIGDNTVMLWNLGWVRYALDHGNPGFWFTNAYYPEGFPFLYGTHTWLDGVFYWLASPVLPGGIDGAILWANITMLIATTASGLLIISALRAWGIRRWPVLMLVSSGAVFSWFRMFAMSGHYHFFGTEWMLLSLCLLSWARVKNLRWVCWAGFALGLAFLNDQSMTVFAAILGGLILLNFPFERRRVWNRARSLGGFYGCSLIPASIHIVPLLVMIIDGRFVYKVETGAARLVDASSFVIPPTHHFIGHYLEDFRSHHGLHWSEGTYLGIVPMCLFALMCWGSIQFLIQKTRRAELRVCFWSTVTACVFLTFAFGDKFMVGGEQYFTMPGRLLKSIPILNNIRLPQRWVWPAQLCICLGGASVLGVALSGWSRSWNRRYFYWIPMALALVPGIEGKKRPAPPPVDFRSDPYICMPDLVASVREHYKGGSVLIMPVRPYFSHGNLLQFSWGYDIPLTLSYTARMPVKPDDVPWRGAVWTPEAAEWLKMKDVQIVIFPFHDGVVKDFQPWIKAAKRADRGLVVLNHGGDEI